MSDKIILTCSLCLSRNYVVRRKSSKTKRLELKKYCKTCNSHTIHKETK